MEILCIKQNLCYINEYTHHIQTYKIIYLYMYTYTICLCMCEHIYKHIYICVSGSVVRGPVVTWDYSVWILQIALVCSFPLVTFTPRFQTQGYWWLLIEHGSIMRWMMLVSYPGCTPASHHLLLGFAPVAITSPNRISAVEHIQI